jgi:hypothetical protein
LFKVFNLNVSEVTYHIITRRYNPADIDLSLFKTLNFLMGEEEAAWTSEMSVTYHNTTRCHNSEDLDMSLFKILNFLMREDGGIMDLQNVCIRKQIYTASQPRRPRLESSPPGKYQILFIALSTMQ